MHTIYSGLDLFLQYSCICLSIKLVVLQVGAIAALGIGASAMSNAISGMKNNAGKALIKTDKEGNPDGLLPKGREKIKDIYSKFKNK